MQERRKAGLDDVEALQHARQHKDHERLPHDAHEIDGATARQQPEEREGRAFKLAEAPPGR